MYFEFAISHNWSACRGHGLRSSEWPRWGTRCSPVTVIVTCTIIWWSTIITRISCRSSNTNTSTSGRNCSWRLLCYRLSGGEVLGGLCCRSCMTRSGAGGRLSRGCTWCNWSAEYRRCRSSCRYWCKRLDSGNWRCWELWFVLWGRARAAWCGSMQLFENFCFR